MKHKRFFSILLILLALVVLAACATPDTGAAEQVSELEAQVAELQAQLEAAQDDSTISDLEAQIAELQTELDAAAEVVAEEPAEEEAAKITLQVYVVDYVADSTDVWLEEEVVPAFQEMYPNVEVEFIWGSWSSFGETVAGYFAAGEGPDIINLGSEFNGLYGDQLAPLNDKLGPDAWDEIENFIPGTLENASWDGELRGLPIFSAPRYVFCRSDLMEAAGYDAQPTDFAGWVEFADALTVVDEGTNTLTQQGFVPVDAASMADFQWYLNTIWSLGGSIYKEDGVTPNFDSEEARAALQFNYDLKRAVYADDFVGGLPESSGSVIEEGNGAVCLWHSGWAAPALDSAVWEQVDIQPFTGDPENFADSQSIVLSFVDWWAVPAYSDNVDMASEFLKFVFSKDNNYKYNETMNLIPARADAHMGYVVENPVLQREAELAAEYSYGFAGIIEPTKLQDILQRELGAFLTDQQDLDTTVNNIQEQYTQALSDAGYLD